MLCAGRLSAQRSTRNAGIDSRTVGGKFQLTALVGVYHFHSVGVLLFIPPRVDFFRARRYVYGKRRGTPSSEKYGTYAGDLRAHRAVHRIRFSIPVRRTSGGGSERARRGAGLF